MQTKDLVGTRYRLRHRIASGGMGEVWAADDELLGRQIALKLLHPHLAADEGFLRRFHAEAKAAARLSHPGIVAVYDYGEEPETAYLAMELVDGEPLSAVIRRRGRLGATETMRIVAQTADALAAAHAEGLVHRDVKPANLLLRPDGQVKVTDFGIVRAADTSTVTRDGTVLGTVAYMSPEQVRGERVTAASDLYSLGVVAYECLNGSRPYEGDESIAVALAHLRDPVPPLPPDVPTGVSELVRGMLDKDPQARPSSAAAVAEAARRLGHDEQAASAPAPRAAGPKGFAEDGSAHTRTVIPSAGGPPTQPLFPDDDVRRTTGAHCLRADKTSALPGLAQPHTMVLAPARPVVFRPRSPGRSWLRVGALCAAALLLAVLLAALRSGGGALAERPKVTVPSLRGLTVGIAEQRLERLGLQPVLGPADPAPSDLVIGQRPSSMTRIARGSKVWLRVRARATHLTTSAPTTTTTTSSTVTSEAGPAGPSAPAPAKGPPGGTGPPGHGGQPPGGGHGH